MTTMWTQRMTTAAATVAMAAALGLGAPVLDAQGRGGQTAGQQGGGRGGGGAQQPARATPAQPATPATGVISGTVTLDGAGTPVRRVRVTISGTEVRGGRSTITNDDGQYTFPALPAGRYTITASKAGYVNVPYGAKKPGRPGTPIQLADGMKMEKADISLPKGGVITGIVVDDNGEPTPRTQVRVLRYVMRTGERTLQQAGSDLTDDRGMYRIYGLQPGDYLVSAVPQNLNVSDIRQTIAAEVEALLQQVNTEGLAALAGRGGGPGGAGGGGRGGRGGGAAGVAGIDINQILGGGRGGGNPQILGRVQQLQEQLAQQDEEQSTAYAPVYYPGTPMPSTASPVSLAIAEERGGVDFRLMLVPTARVEGTIASPTGELPQGTQITLMPLDQNGMPPIAGANNDNTRVGQDGAFSFRDIPPGQYRVMARGAVRQVDPNAPAGQGGRGGRGGGFGGRGGGQIAQVLWGAADINVNGENVTGVTITLQEGMTVTGRIAFETSTGLPPTDMSNVRVNLSPRGAQQGLDIGGVPPAEMDASGRFTIKGVLPGKYTISANVPGGGGGRGGGRGGAGATGVAGVQAAPTVQWVLKSAVANGLEALDFGLVVEPNQNVNTTILFSDKNQEVSGTIQDTMGNPTADYTVVLFASDKAYWVPQSRRIQASRPGTDGKFSFRNLPAGNYSLTAVTDVEPGEWFDPAFLEQLVNASIPVIVREGEKKTQDIKVAAGG